MNYSPLFYQLLVIVAVGYVFCDPSKDGLFQYCYELNNVESDYFYPISDELKKYVCHNDPINGNGNIDYTILYQNDDEDDDAEKWITCLSFDRTETQVTFLNDKQLVVYVKKVNDWKLVEFEFTYSEADEMYSNLTEILDGRQAINKNDSIMLQRLTGEGYSASLDFISFAVSIYLETFDPEPNNFDCETIMIFIVRSSHANSTFFVLSKGDFWISRVKDKYIALFIENYENYPYVIHFMDSVTAKEYRKTIIDWVREDKRDVPFPEYLLRMVLS